MAALAGVDLGFQIGLRLADRNLYTNACSAAQANLQSLSYEAIILAFRNGFCPHDAPLVLATAFGIE